MLRRQVLLAFCCVAAAFALYFAAVRAFPVWHIGGRCDLIGGRTLSALVIRWHKGIDRNPDRLSTASELRVAEAGLAATYGVVIHRSCVGGSTLELTFTDGTVERLGIYMQGDGSWGLIGRGGGMCHSEWLASWCRSRLAEGQSP